MLKPISRSSTSDKPLSSTHQRRNSARSSSVGCLTG
jgi:hypothetical protein